MELLLKVDFLFHQKVDRYLYDLLLLKNVRVLDLGSNINVDNHLIKAEIFNILNKKFLIMVLYKIL